MARVRSIIPVVALLAAVISPAAAEERTISGELVDPAAYVKQERRGVEASDATYEALEGGQTLALLEDGTGQLYLLFAEQAGEDPNELAYDYVNQPVRVTGEVYERGGLRGIVPSLIEPAAVAVGAPGPADGGSLDAPPEAP
jgi:hypothetical protein